MDWKLELVMVPVTDVDRAKIFYTEKMGFHVDVDHHPSDEFRVVQLTPPGSACSITIGIGVTQATPGSVEGLHLVVNDIDAAHAQLSERDVEASEIFHFDAGKQTSGPHPNRSDYNSFIAVSDPDGNRWVVQEVGHQQPGA